MKNEHIACKFINGEIKGRTENLFIEGNVIYSYRLSYPLCLRLNDLKGGYKFILNKTKYSQTTSKHLSCLKRQIKDEDILEITDLKGINTLINEYPKITNTDEFILYKIREETKK